jgi:hypothetical protein
MKRHLMYHMLNDAASGYYNIVNALTKDGDKGNVDAQMQVYVAQERGDRLREVAEMLWEMTDEEFDTIRRRLNEKKGND